MGKDGNTYEILGAAEFWPRTDKLKAGHAPAVTSILSTVLAKPNLLPWAVKLQDELWIEAITTAEGINGPEIHRGDITSSVYKGASTIKRHKLESRRAMAIGQEVHDRIEALLTAKEYVHPQSGVEPIDTALDAWLHWRKHTDFESEWTEQVVWHRSLRYAGTADVYGRNKIVDWKTSSAIYPEYRLQVAAYKAGALHTGKVLIGTSCSILRLPKTRFEFDNLIHKFGHPWEEEELSAADESKAFEAFQAVLNVYNWLKDQ